MRILYVYILILNFSFAGYSFNPENIALSGASSIAFDDFRSTNPAALAFHKGITMKVMGNCNDYFGKGLSGGKLIVQVPKESSFEADKNIIIGNVALYGATSGEIYVNGIRSKKSLINII